LRVSQDPILGVFWGLELLLGYLASSGAKSDIIFLLSGPNFLQGWWNMARISRSFRDLMQDRWTDNRRQTQRPKQKALTL